MSRAMNRRVFLKGLLAVSASGAALSACAPKPAPAPTAVPPAPTSIPPTAVPPTVCAAAYDCPAHCRPTDRHGHPADGDGRGGSHCRTHGCTDGCRTGSRGRRLSGGRQGGQR